MNTKLYIVIPCYNEEKNIRRLTERFQVVAKKMGEIELELVLVDNGSHDNTQREIAQALSGLEPAIDVKVEYIDVPEYPGNKVIAMWFDGWVWGKQPYTYHGCPYYKPESVTRQMPREMFE